MMSIFKVELTQTAEEVYRQVFNTAQRILRSGAKDANTHPKVKQLRILDDCINNLIPNDPFNPTRGLVGNLSNIFRVKKGRTRICYAASSQQSVIVILYISETLRKEGDKNDPYALFTNLVMSGKYDEVFDALGVSRPHRSGAAQLPFIQ